MLYLYLDGTLRSADLEADTLTIKNQIQQRADTVSFRLIGGTKPEEWDDIRIFKGTTIAGFSGVTVTLDPYFQDDVGYFYPGQKLMIRIGDSDEESVEVLTYDEDAMEIVLVAAPSGTVSVGDKIGFQIFGGTMLAPKTVNVTIAENIEYECTGTDYTKLFDKKLISDTWEDVDSRYIINDVCNTTINFNVELNDMDYADNAAVQSNWTESNDGTNPTNVSSGFIQGVGAVQFNWTYSGGQAWFTDDITAVDCSELVGASTGAPTEGNLTFWYKRTSASGISNLRWAICSGSGANCLLIDHVPESDTDWHFVSIPLTKYASVDASTNWAAINLLQLRVSETTNAGIIIDDVRITAEGSFTLYNVQETPAFDDFRAPRTKPTAFMQLLATTWEYIWYIDYERDIHFVSSETEGAPWDATNDNVVDLQTEVDASQVGNRIQIEGGEETSASVYAEIKQGDDATREWVLKTKFNNLEISLDDNGTTAVAGAGTTTTNIELTGHGLSNGDHVVNRTTGVVREVTVVDPNNLTVEADAAMAPGDTISFFSTVKTSGVEGIDDETLFNYMQNSNEKSVRSSSAEPTLTTTDYIRFSYNERVPIQLQYHDSASSDALKAIGLGDGIFDLDPIIDGNIDSRALAISIAQAKVSTYSNPTISGTYRTDQHGVRAGMIQRIIDSNRSFDAEHVVQTVTLKQKGGQFYDNFRHSVMFGTTLFGWIEFMQKLQSTKDNIEVNTDAVVATFVTANETVESSDVNSAEINGGDERAASAETVESGETNTVDTLATGTWRYEPNGVGQTFESRFDLADFG